MSAIAQLVDRQLKRWELERRAAEEQRTQTSPAPRQSVSVTVSRMRGCRGPAIVEHLAERLGYQLFDKEIIDFIASNRNLHQRVLDMLDETVASGIRLWAEGIVAGRHVDRRDFVRFLSGTVRAIYEHGNAVIIGRGANCILAGRVVFRVQLTAPLDARVEQIMREDNLTEEQARDEVRRADEQREAFIRDSFGADWHDPALHDLTINVESLRAESVAEIIENCMRRFAVERWPDAVVGRRQRQ